MTSLMPYWWLALPVLLLPIWWHRRRRQRPDAIPLASARFLPAASPVQVRVWRWRQPWLLLVRCLLLVTLIAWLALTIFPWRGDTVLVDPQAGPAWVTQQIAEADMASAQRMALPVDSLAWLRRNERDWRDGARVLILARSGAVAMPALRPQFNHRVTLRTAPPVAAANAAASAATATTASAAAAAAATALAPATALQHVMVAAPALRDDAWRALFAAFAQAGGVAGGASPYAVRYTGGAPVPEALPHGARNAPISLIIWDTPGHLPPARWHAPHWWIADGAVLAQLLPAGVRATSVSLDGVAWQYADTTRGRVWTTAAMPPRDAASARAMYDSWRALEAAPAPAYPAPPQVFAGGASLPVATDAQPASAIALAMLALFLLERIMCHARRR